MSQSEIDKALQSAKRLLIKKQIEKAESILISAISKLNQTSSLQNLLGLCKQQKSKYAEALKFFQKSHEQNKQFMEPVYNMMATLCDIGLYEEAEKIFKQQKANNSFTSHKNNPNLKGNIAKKHIESAKAYLELKYFDEALLEYQKALNLIEFLPDVKVSMGKILLDQNKYELAQKYLEEAIYMSPQNCEAHLFIGLIHFKLGAKNLAKQCWEKAEAANPTDLSARSYKELSKSWHLDPRNA